MLFSQFATRTLFIIIPLNEERVILNGLENTTADLEMSSKNRILEKNIKFVLQEKTLYHRYQIPGSSRKRTLAAYSGYPASWCRN